MPIAAPKLNQKMMSIYVPSVTLALVVFRQAANGARDRQRHQIPSPPATSVTTVTPACAYVLRTEQDKMDDRKCTVPWMVS